MAERQEYQVPPARTGTTAQDMLHTLTESLHEHGFLRLLNDVVRANTDIASILVSGLNQPGGQNAMQNLSLLFMTLSKIPPEHFNHLLQALKSGVMAVRQDNSRDEPKQEETAPGVLGMMKLLNDEDLWRGLMPIVNGLKAFGEEIQKEEQKPVTRNTGKETHE
ncbi:DUF1641 domain-containing protein [Rahnella aquatilis]|uniref:DUF1641 domain-containing protein n=1 Tax=Rahnella aquatilis TaxID=34038 RepID=UPI003649C4F7